MSGSVVGDDPTKRELFEFERRKFDDDQAIKRQELDRQVRNEAFGFFKSPLFLAVIGGLVTILVNSVANYYSTRNTLELEQQRLQADLVKKYLEPPDLQTRKDNLNFLVQAGLIPRFQSQIAKYLVDHPNAIPQTASATTTLADGRSFGASNMLNSDVLAKIDKIRKALVIVRSRQGATDWMRCTGVLTSANKVVTIGYCAETNMGLGAADNRNLKVEVASGVPSIAVLNVKRIGDGTPSAALTVLTLASPVANKVFLEIDEAPPSIGQKLILPFLGATPEDLLVSFDDDCKVTDLKGENEIAYRCDGDAGSGGAPIISFESGKILAIHSIATQEARWGIRVKADDLTD